MLPISKYLVALELQCAVQL